MTSQTLVPRALFVANGVQTAFGFSFPVFEAEDMEVWIDQTLQTAGAYAISGVGVAVGGTVIFTVPPPAASQVTLRRRMALNRAPEFPDTAVQATPLNEEFGYHVAALQQISDEAALAVKRSFRSLSSADLTLPEPEAGKALRWNDSGDGLANSVAEVDAVLSLVTEAAASAASASGHQTSAFTSAQAAAAAAAAAGVSETAASAARTAAEAALDLAEGHAAAADVARIEWKGAWSGATAYAVNDAVSHNGSSWICVAAHTNHAPADDAWWDRLAAKGIDGFGAGDMLAANNLSDLADPAAARGNLGLSAVAASGAYADLSGKPSLGTAAALDAGVASGQVPQLTATGLPALDASQLTALNASALASGTAPPSRLGSGTPDASTFLRGDGAWTSLSTGILQSGSQTFTSNGTFVVPDGITTLGVFAVAGGQGGSDYAQSGGAGGNTSFGSFLVVAGGANSGNAMDLSVCIGFTQPSDGAATMPCFGSQSIYGRGGAGNSGTGNPGSMAFAVCKVTPGASIVVTIGAGGAGGVYYPGSAGAVFVRY